VKWNDAGFAAAVISIAVLLTSSTADAEVVLSDSLIGGTSGNNEGGEFTAKGWMAPHQIWWDLGQEITAGGMSVELLNWNPNEDSPQHQYQKQHIVNMYEMAHGSPHQSDGDDPKTSFFNVRTGATYDNHFKFLSSTGGFEDRQETRVKCTQPCIDPEQMYTLRIEWNEAGDISIYENDVPQITHHHGKLFHLRYVFLGTDNAPPGTYGPQQWVIYRNLEVWSEGGGGPDPDPEDCVDLTFEPVADTWIEPSDPGKNHGGNPELRVGGDGRTIFFRFAPTGLGEVEAARLILKALNGGGGGDLRAVDDDGWSETEVTSNSHPVWGDGIIDSPGNVEIGQLVQFDLGDAIPGDNVWSFAITSEQTDGSGYHSRESGDQHPALVVTSCPSSVEPGPEPMDDVVEAPPDLVEEVITDAPGGTDNAVQADQPPDLSSPDPGTPDTLGRSNDGPESDHTGFIIDDAWPPPKPSDGCGVGSRGSPPPTLLAALLAMLVLLRRRSLTS